MNWPFDPLVPMKYGAILADPPWPYEMRSAKGYGRAPEAHYETMPVEEIKALPVNPLAGPDCLLFLWSTWPHLPAALEVIEAWGFTYKTGGSWTKLTKTGKVAMGGGYIFRSSTEPYLVATLGAPSFPDRGIRNIIQSVRREHSRKPPEAREIVRRLRPDAWACELFATEPWSEGETWAPKAHAWREAADG